MRRLATIWAAELRLGHPSAAMTPDVFARTQDEDLTAMTERVDAASAEALHPARATRRHANH